MLQVAEIAAELQRQQRQRAIIIKSRIMMANRIQAIIAGTIGYHAGMPEKERRKVFTEAAKVIKAVIKGTARHELEGVIATHHLAIQGFDERQKALEKSMVRLVAELPVSAWVEAPEQRGFGLLMLAVVIGETGDLAGYSNPAKLWRRLGCAPWTCDGQTRMGSTWRSGREGKLPSYEWEAFGYSPRRRSIAYLIGECLVKQNGGGRADDNHGDTARCPVGTYRRRYDEAKARAAVVHPDWKPKRCHLHGMLLATKLLLRELWNKWNGKSHATHGYGSEAA